MLQFVFFTKNFLLDLLNFEKLCFWVGLGVGLGDMYTFHYFQMILAPLVLLKWLYLKLGRSLYSVTHTNNYIALEVGFHLAGHMYLTLVGGVIRRNHDL